MTPTLTGGSLTAVDVDELIASSPVPVVLVFGAAWCPPCRTYEPVLAEIATEHAGRLAVRKIDCDRLPDLVVRWAISSAPTTLVFVAGALVERVVGARSRAAMLELVSRHL